MMGEPQDTIQRTIKANLAFRMAVAIANPKAYETNLSELASILADDVAKALKKADRLKP